MLYARLYTLMILAAFFLLPASAYAQVSDIALQTRALDFVVNNIQPLEDFLQSRSYIEQRRVYYSMDNESDVTILFGLHPESNSRFINEQDTLFSINKSDSNKLWKLYTEEEFIKKSPTFSRGECHIKLLIYNPIVQYNIYSFYPKYYVRVYAHTEGSKVRYRGDIICKFDHKGNLVNYSYMAGNE